MKINIIIMTSLLVVCLSTNATHDEQNSASQNIIAASKFMETLLTDRETADSLLHPDFDFLFMGISPHLSNVPYNKETYWSSHRPVPLPCWELGTKVETALPFLQVRRLQYNGVTR